MCVGGGLLVVWGGGGGVEDMKREIRALEKNSICDYSKCGCWCMFLPTCRSCLACCLKDAPVTLSDIVLKPSRLAGFGPNPSGADSWDLLTEPPIRS